MAKQTFPQDVDVESFSCGYNDGERGISILKNKNDRSSDKPLIIFIHGGAWIYGSKDLHNYFLASMVKKGFNVASIGYRLADKVLMKDIVRDVFDGVRYLYNHKEDFGVSFENVTVGGDSAGGHLSLLFGVLNNNKDIADKLNLEQIDIEIKHLMLIHPVPYLTLAATLEGHKILTKYVTIPGFLRMMFGKDYKNDLWYKTIKDPTDYINKDTKLPKIILITSTEDYQYYYQSVMFNKYLNSLNIDHYFLHSNEKNTPHVYNVLYPDIEPGLSTNNKIVEILKGKISK